MEPEITLLAVFCLALFIGKLRTGKYKFAMAGRAGMSALLILTGIAHFAFLKGMTMMLPGFVPGKVFLVYFTGVLELAAAVGLQLQRWRRATAICLILFLVLLTPANIYATSIHLNEQTGTLDGPGLEYLWYRIPFQIFLITWVYLSALKQKRVNKGAGKVVSLS